MTFRDSNTAFDEAIAAGRLSASPDSDLYAGRYMYMGTVDGSDQFKHIHTRQYLPTPVVPQGPANAQEAVVCLQHIINRFPLESDVIYEAANAIAEIGIEAAQNGTIIDPLMGSDFESPAQDLKPASLPGRRKAYENNRFCFEGPFHLWDSKEMCYWVRESQAKMWSER